MAPLHRGLGVERLLVKFLKLYCDPHALILVVNTTQTHEVTTYTCLHQLHDTLTDFHVLQEYFISELVKEGVEHLPRQVTNEIAAKERFPPSL